MILTCARFTTGQLPQSPKGLPMEGLQHRTDESLGDPQLPPHRPLLTGIRPVRPRDHRKFQPSGFRPSSAHSTQRSHLWGGFQPPIASLPKPFPSGFRRIQNQSPVPFPAQPRTVRSGNGGLLGGSRKKNQIFPHLPSKFPRLAS